MPSGRAQLCAVPTTILLAILTRLISIAVLLTIVDIPVFVSVVVVVIEGCLSSSVRVASSIIKHLDKVVQTSYEISGCTTDFIDGSYNLAHFLGQNHSLREFLNETVGYFCNLVVASVGALVSTVVLVLLSSICAFAVNCSIADCLSKEKNESERESLYHDA